IETFEIVMDRAGWDSGQVSLFSFHIMGTARLGDSPKISATNPDGETWEVKNLFVMDGSSFPSASGVNPMISIEAIAHRNAQALAGKLSSNLYIFRPVRRAIAAAGPHRAKSRRETRECRIWDRVFARPLCAASGFPVGPFCKRVLVPARKYNGQFQRE